MLKNPKNFVLKKFRVKKCVKNMVGKNQGFENNGNDGCVALAQRNRNSFIHIHEKRQRAIQNCQEQNLSKFNKTIYVKITRIYSKLATIYAKYTEVSNGRKFKLGQRQFFTFEEMETKEAMLSNPCFEPNHVIVK